MSIWNSIEVDRPGILARDLHDPDVDEHRATGPARVTIDVATATDWHDRIRITVDSDDDQAHTCIAIDPGSAQLLRDCLDQALLTIAVRRVTAGAAGGEDD